MNQFIDPALAEDRNVFCGRCGEPVKGHLPGCPHCRAPFHANMHGYARLCKNSSCQRTEMAGHPHGLCRMHHQQRRGRQEASARQPNCACGSKATYGFVDCSRCRATPYVREVPKPQPGVALNITVHVEWPGGSEDVELEMPGDSTAEDIHKTAEETLFSLCNFGYSINGEIQ